MPLNHALRKRLLAAAIVLVASCGVGVHWFWYPSKLSTYATLLLVATAVLLMRQAARWQMFQSPAHPFAIPTVQANWNLRAFRTGLLYFFAAFAWVGLILFGIRMHVLDTVSVPVAFLLLSPSGVLIALAIFHMMRGMFSQDA